MGRGRIGLLIASGPGQSSLEGEERLGIGMSGQCVQQSLLGALDRACDEFRFHEPSVRIGVDEMKSGHRALGRIGTARFDLERRPSPECFLARSVSVARLPIDRDCSSELTAPLGDSA
jgi:hypothetical protein